MQIPIDECEEWIWESLNCPSDCGFEYVRDGNKEFLIFNTNEFDFWFYLFNFFYKFIAINVLNITSNNLAVTIFNEYVVALADYYSHDELLSFYNLMLILL